MTEIKIDNEFMNRHRKHTDDEYTNLKELIKAQSLLSPILVWDGENLIVDGHHRHRACEELGIQPRYVFREFPNRERVLLEIDKIQAGTRNVDPETYALILLRIQDNDIKSSPYGENPPKPSHKKKDEKPMTTKDIATKSKASPRTVDRLKAIVKSGDKAVIDKVQSKEMTPTEAERIVTGKPKPKPKPKTPTPEGERYPIESRAGQPIINLSYRDHKEKIGYYAIVTFTDEKAEVEEKTTAYHEVTLDSCLWRCDKCPRSVSSEQGLSDLKREGKCPGCGVPISAED